jgi:uncharacterized protein (TIGR02996 family)
MSEVGLLRAIIDDPDDDAVRLVYCDWLEEHAGEKNAEQARAELIRGQIELARTAADSPTRRKLAFRVRQLLDRFGEEWLGPLRKLVHDWHCHRGFLDKVGISADTLQEHADLLFDSAPLRRLWVTGLHGDLAPLRCIPDRHTLTSLDLCYNQLSSDALKQLTTFPSLGRLRNLGLMFNQIDDEGARLLREHPFFQGLSLIRCGANPIRAAARQELRQHFGYRVGFICERDDDHLYSIQNDDAFTAGFGKDDTQLLFRSSWRVLRVVLFDHEGNLLDIHRRDRAWDEESEKEEAAKQAWMKELGFRAATIRVKRFTFEDGEGIRGFNRWQDAFNDPNHPQAEVHDSAGEWLKGGSFEWNFLGGNCWLDGTGKVTDTSG